MKTLSCIYSCTSAGLIWQIKLDIASDGKVARNGGSFRTLPEPLQCCEFEPKSEPRFFAYGGEDVALSVNDVGKFFSAADEDDEESQDENNDGADQERAEEQEESSKTKKRRRAAERRAKAKELMRGEIWRAKNLPADELKLAVQASIVSIAFLEDTKLVVGTRHGLLRLYEVGPRRKALKQISLFRPKVAPAKHLVRSHNDGQLIAADTTGRVYVVDWRTGTLLYKYEG
jgi:ribosome biogenesis protein NSA1